MPELIISMDNKWYQDVTDEKSTVTSHTTALLTWCPRFIMQWKREAFPWKLRTTRFFHFSRCWLGLLSQITSASGRSLQGILLFDSVLLFYKMTSEMSVWDVCSGLLLLGIAEGCHWSPDSRPLQSSPPPTSVTWVVERSRRKTAWLQIRQRWQMSGSLFSRVQVETKSLLVNKRCGCPMRAKSKVLQGTSAEKVRVKYEMSGYSPVQTWLCTLTTINTETWNNKVTNRRQQQPSRWCLRKRYHFLLTVLSEHGEQ